MPANANTVSPNEDLLIPKWITEEYFTQILQKDEPDHKKVLQFSRIAAIPPGENFCSIMVRICITLEMKDGSSKQKSYVVKTMLEQEKGGEIVKLFGFFPKEIEMYQKYIPAFEALYKEVGHAVQFAPKCLHTEYSDNVTAFIFEDLKEQHFDNANRLYGFDMPHMRRVLHKLAEFHAASVVWAERNGAYPKEFANGFATENDVGREFQEKTFNTKIKSYKKAMATWGLENAEKYISKFPTIEQFVNCGKRSTVTDAKEFNVLNHGDFWSSNIMLNYLTDGQEIDQVLVVDYQLCKWGSPAQDLLFFITISAAKDIRIKEFDHFVAIYHAHLIDCLQLLNYKKTLPKLRDIQMAMFKENNTFYAFFAVYNHLVAVLLPTDKDSNIHSLMRNDEFGDKFRMRAFTNPLYVEAMLDLYPFFHRRGLFNFEDFD